MKKKRKKKKQKVFPIVTCALATIILLSSLYTYVKFSTKASAYATHIENIKINSNISDDYLTEFEKEKIEKEKQKQEDDEKRKEQIKNKFEETKNAINSFLKSLIPEPKEEPKEEDEIKEDIPKEKSSPILPESNIMKIGMIKQLPELKNGCEVTSVAMMLNYAGVNVDKMTLANKVKKDTTPIKYDNSGHITQWGNPDVGFVGDITGMSAGYSINPQPLLELVNQYVKGVNLTNLDYTHIERTLADNRPVVVWTTINFTEPQINTAWKNGNNTITAYFNQHAVLLTGYDKDYVYFNDPLTGKVNDRISKKQFLNIWTSTGRKAITYER